MPHDDKIELTNLNDAKKLLKNKDNSIGIHLANESILNIRKIIKNSEIDIRKIRINKKKTTKD